MSNALSSLMAQAALAQAPSTLPATTKAVEWGMLHPLAVALMSVGFCTLVVWSVRRLARPGKLLLARTPGRSNSLNPAHLLLPLAMWLLSMAAAKTLLRRFLPQDSYELMVLVGIIGQVFWLATSLVVAAIAFDHGLRRGLGLSLRHWIYDTGRGVLGYLAIYPVFFGLVWGMSWLTGPTAEHEMLKALRATSPAWSMAGIVSAVILAPLAEEVFCRGLLQSMLRRYTHRPWVAILLAAGVFALLHSPYWQHMPALFALAVSIGYNYERCGRLYPAFLIHGLFNAVNIAISLAATP